MASGFLILNLWLSTAVTFVSVSKGSRDLCVCPCVDLVFLIGKVEYSFPVRHLFLDGLRSIKNYGYLRSCTSSRRH